MKKLLLTLFLFTAIIQVSQAQQNRDEKIQALKIAFLTERLQLTSAEAQQFWPVYNSYENEVRKIRKISSDGDVLENEEKLLQIRKKYSASFEKILGKEKTNTLFKAERDFRNILIKRLKNRGGRGY